MLGKAGSVLAFGISPPWVHADHLVPGSHYEQIIYLTQANPQEPLDIEVMMDPSETNSWFKFEPGNTFAIPAGAQQFPMKVIIDVPEDAGYETYNTRIRVRAMSGGEGQVAVLVGGIIDARLIVSGEEFSDFQIKSVKVKDIEEGWPIKVFIKMENLGNVKTRPSRVHVNVYDQYQSDLLESSDASDISWLESFKTGEVVAQAKTKLDIGSYWAEVEVYKKGELASKEKLTFRVLERGTIKPYPVFLGISIYTWAAVLFAVLLLAAGFKLRVWKKILNRIGLNITIQKVK